MNTRIRDYSKKYKRDNVGPIGWTALIVLMVIGFVSLIAFTIVSVQEPETPIVTGSKPRTKLVQKIETAESSPPFDGDKLRAKFAEQDRIFNLPRLYMHKYTSLTGTWMEDWIEDHLKIGGVEQSSTSDYKTMVYKDEFGGMIIIVYKYKDQHTPRDRVSESGWYYTSKSQLGLQ